jgi:general secretion pathway protein M
MIEKLQQYIQKLSPRERTILLGGGAVALILLIAAIVLPLQRSVSTSEARIQQKRDDLVWLRSVAPQLGTLQNSRRPSLDESLVVLIDRTARESGMSQALVGSQPSGDGGLNVRLEKLPFDTLIGWLSQLHQQYGVRVDSATVDSANEVGTVTATLVLHAG